MGGLLLDIVVAFVFKTIALAVKGRGSGRWISVRGTVLAANSQIPALGCATAEVVYTFAVHGRKYSGLYERPFLSSGAAQSYARQFRPGQEIFVRAKPTDPSISVIR